MHKENMGKYILIIMALAITLPIAIEQICPVQFGIWLEDHKSFISSLNILSILGLLFSLYLTVYHFNKTQRNREKTLVSEHNTRISTLIKELEVNKSICENEIISSYNRNKDKESLPVPESKFHIEILKAMLVSGGIPEDQTNTELWNCYRYMEVANSLLYQALQILHYEHIADPRDMMLINGRTKKINNLIKDVFKYAEGLNKSIPVLLSLLERKKIAP